jgi:hypothetical protein
MSRYIEIRQLIEIVFNCYVKHSCSLRRLNVIPIENKRNGDQKKLSPLPWNYLFKVGLGLWWE